MIQKELEYVLNQYKSADNIAVLENLVIIFNAKVQELLKSKQISTKQLEEIIAYENQL